MTDYEIARLEKARGYYHMGNERDRMMLEDLFPEFRESGDERIREQLIDYFECFRFGNADSKWNGINVRHILSLLKKQKLAEWSIYDAKPGDILNSTRVHATIIFKGFNPDGKHIDAFCALQKGIFISGELPWDRDFEPASDEWKKRLFTAMTEKGYEFVASKLELRPINKSAEWSKEDKDALAQAIIAIEDMIDEDDPQRCYAGHTQSFIKVKERLESLRPQPKREWTKEEKSKFDRIYHVLSLAADTHAFSTTSRLIGDKEAVELQDFLRSIAFPKHHWKPTEEQMDGLKWWCDYLKREGFDAMRLDSLYDDLQKL